MKQLPKTLLAMYLLLLLWLVLFKFSLNLPAFFDQARSLNVTPFAHYSWDNIRELIYNFLVFIPFGLFLSVNLKRTNFRQKLAIVFAFSLSVEIVQLVLAIGVADITDVISNTAGGLFGLAIYRKSNKYIDGEKLDPFIVVAGTGLLVATILSLSVLFISGVRFQGPSRGQLRTLYR